MDGVAETTRGQLAAAEGLVCFQLQTNSPNTPFASVLPHLGSALESHARVQAHYTRARAVAATTDPSFRMPLEGPRSPQPGSQGGDGTQGTGSQAQVAGTSEARCNAMLNAIHMHYGIHLCESYGCQIRKKFASTADSHVCWHVAVNVNLCEFCANFMRI